MMRAEHDGAVNIKYCMNKVQETWDDNAGTKCDLSFLYILFGVK
jgi:hypothetical protein